MGKKIIIYALVVALFVPAVVFGGQKVSELSNLDIDGSDLEDIEYTFRNDTLDAELEAACAELNDESEFGVTDLLSIVKGIIDAKSTSDRYQMILQMSEDIQKLLKKVENIETILTNMIKQSEIKDYQKAIDARRDVMNGLDKHSEPVIGKVYNDVKDSSGNVPADWFEKNYEKILPLLDEWASEPVVGTVCHTQIITYIQGVSTRSLELKKNMPEIYDALALKTFEWENQGYSFREKQRILDILSTIVNASLLDIYYEAREKYEGSSYQSYHQQIMDSLTMFYNTFSNAPVTHHDNQMICQIDGLVGKKFEFDVDYLNLCDPIRSACQSSSFDAAAKDGSNNKSLLENAFNTVKAYKDSKYKTAAAYTGSYNYQPSSTYTVLWNFYSQKLKSDYPTINGKAYSTLSEALSAVGFKGIENIGNIYFVYDNKTPYRSSGSFSKNYVDYRSFKLEIRSWKKNKDTIFLTSFENKSGRTKNETLIYNCNFKGSASMTNPGTKANNNFMSLREIK